MAAAVHACAAQMREGGTLVGSLVRTGMFPELSLRLIAVGEQSGQLETMLARVAEIYEAALQPKTFVTVRGGHVYASERDPQFFPAIREFLSTRHLLP